MVWDLEIARVFEIRMKIDHLETLSEKEAVLLSR
jgi:hypothetical protein